MKQTFAGPISRATEPFGRAAAAIGLTPNWITTIGLAGTIASAAVITTGNVTAAGWVLVAAGLMDTLDGATARAAGNATPFGGFYDSVVDRLSDGIILGAIAWHVRDDAFAFALALIALVAAEVTSYVRARAEAIDLRCDKGLLERAERSILLMVGLVFHDVVLFELTVLTWVLAISAVGSAITVGQRVHHVWCQVDRDLPPEVMAAFGTNAVWSRAFVRAARRFYGPQNFDASWQQHRDEPVPDKVLESRLAELAAERVALMAEARAERREERREERDARRAEKTARRAVDPESSDA